MPRPIIRYTGKDFKFDLHEMYPSYWASIKLKEDNFQGSKWDPTMFTEGVKWRFCGGYISFGHRNEHAPYDDYGHPGAARAEAVRQRGRQEGRHLRRPRTGILQGYFP